MMRWLVIGVVSLSALWGGWWFAGSSAVERGANAAVAQARTDGWRVDIAELSVSGFPNRFDTTLSDLVIAPPGAAWTWTAPFFQVFALAYRPNHIIAVGAPSQQVDTAFGPVTLLTDDLRASVVARAGPALTLDRATVTTAQAKAEIAEDRLSLASGLIAAQSTGVAQRYDLAARLVGLTLPEAWLHRAQLERALPTQVEGVHFDAQAGFTQPIDRHLTGPPGLTDLTIREAALNWGPVEVRIRGELTAGTVGRANGTLIVEIQDLEAVLAVLEGRIPPERLEFGARFLAGFATDDLPDGARVELGVRDGLVALGPIPLGVLPPLNPPG